MTFSYTPVSISSSRIFLADAISGLPTPSIGIPVSKADHGKHQQGACGGIERKMVPKAGSRSKKLSFIGAYQLVGAAWILANSFASLSGLANSHLK